VIKLNEEEEQKAQQLHRKSIVVDMMNASILPDEASEEIYVNKLISSGVTASNMCVATSQTFRQTIERIYKWCKFIEKFSDKLMLAKNALEIIDAKKKGKIAILFAFQNTAPIESDLNLLYIFRQLGITTMQVTYNERNLAGDGCTEITDCGLSDFGVDMIKEMNRLKIAIDLSHVGRATTKDVLKVTKAPVFCTHAGAYKINPNPRNKTDEELRAIARTGGLVGGLSLGAFLSKSSPDKITVEDFLNHIDHLVKVIGVDHVGFGLDFSENSKPTDYPTHKAISDSGWPWYYAKGLESVSDIPNITRGLLTRKYSDSEVEMILGNNFLRVFRQITE
jgi:membrane dipeptidase